MIVNNDEYIKIENLEYSYLGRSENIEVLVDLNLKVKKGEFISILGSSGCGKTTLLKIIGGLLTDYSGLISVDSKSPSEIREDREFAFVFQNPVLFNWRTVISNILLPSEIFKSKQNYSSTIGKKRIETAIQMLNLVGLKGFEKAFPSQLSGGMQSRVAIARALSYSPKILLMDEPFGDLDEFTRIGLNVELTRLWKKTKSTILFITHSITEAILMSDKIVILSDRPASVREIINIDIPRPRPSSIELSEQYGYYFRKIKNALLI